MCTFTKVEYTDIHLFVYEYCSGRIASEEYQRQLTIQIIIDESVFNSAMQISFIEKVVFQEIAQKVQ